MLSFRGRYDRVGNFAFTSASALLSPQQVSPTTAPANPPTAPPVLAACRPSRPPMPAPIAAPMAAYFARETAVLIFPFIPVSTLPVCKSVCMPSEATFFVNFSLNNFEFRAQTFGELAFEIRIQPQQLADFLSNQSAFGFTDKYMIGVLSGCLIDNGFLKNVPLANNVVSRDIIKRGFDSPFQLAARDFLAVLEQGDM